MPVKRFQVPSALLYSTHPPPRVLSPLSQAGLSFHVSFIHSAFIFCAMGHVVVASYQILYME
jgi:hypothetical protein